jgi:hypothetical protein
MKLASLHKLGMNMGSDPLFMDKMDRPGKLNNEPDPP